ncbi:ester cyclase [Plantactinospora siamensis]|uniref:Ester cyclase n=1 Tax=Plantactinospora siamensis TaxID=555372 RepID=A0ABV6P1T5_9ACTN
MTDTRTSNLAVFQRFHEATNSGDIDHIARVVDELAPDVLFHAPAPVEATGAAALKFIWAALLRAFPDIHVTVEDTIAEDDKIVFRNTVTGTNLGPYRGMPPTGRAVRYDEIFVVRFAGGRIAEIWGVVDLFTQLRQLGLVDGGPVR